MVWAAQQRCGGLRPTAPGRVPSQQHHALQATDEQTNKQTNKQKDSAIA